MTAGTSWADAASAEKPRKALIGEAFAADDGDLPPEFPPIGTAQPARHDHASAVTVAFLTSEKAPVSRVERLTWADLSAMLGRVEPGGKTGAAWMPAEIEQGARTAKRVHALSALVLDVEAARRADPQTGVKTVIGTEPPAFEDMVTELDAWGWRAIVHTTHSHHDPAILPADVPHARYRVVLAVSRPLTPAEAPVLGAHVVDVLGLARDAVDGAALRDVARLFFLPRCPADRLGEFRHADVAGEPLDVDRLLTDAARARDALKGASARTRSPKTGGVIDAFNAAHDVGAILEAHGYRRSGRRWLYPHSTTGAPGVRLLPDSSPPRINSGHADDPLADGHAHDAFDVWRILEHGGDQRAAVRAAAELLGIEREAPPVGVDVEALRRSSKARQQGAARADQDGGEPGEPCLNLATGGHGAGDDDGGQRARLPVAPSAAFRTDTGRRAVADTRAAALADRRLRAAGIAYSTVRRPGCRKVPDRPGLGRERGSGAPLGRPGGGTRAGSLHRRRRSLRHPKATEGVGATQRRRTETHARAARCIEHRRPAV